MLIPEYGFPYVPLIDYLWLLHLHVQLYIFIFVFRLWTTASSVFALMPPFVYKNSSNYKHTYIVYLLSLYL